MISRSPTSFKCRRSVGPQGAREISSGQVGQVSRSHARQIRQRITASRATLIHVHPPTFYIVNFRDDPPQTVRGLKALADLLAVPESTIFSVLESGRFPPPENTGMRRAVWDSIGSIEVFKFSQEIGHFPPGMGINERRGIPVEITYADDRVVVFESRRAANHALGVNSAHVLYLDTGRLPDRGNPIWAPIKQIRELGGRGRVAVHR